jgi:hypothetical protein
LIVNGGTGKNSLRWIAKSGLASLDNPPFL